MLRTLCVCFAAALASCHGGVESSEPLSGAGGSGASDLDGSGNAAGAASADAQQEEGAQPVNLLGTWNGYVENFQLSDDSDALSMKLDSLDGVVSGTVVFGTSPAPPPPQDPDAGYPPSTQCHSYNECVYHPFPGFAYSINDGKFDGVRLRFSISYTQLITDWCAMQTPIADEANPGGYLCVHNWSVTFMDDDTCFLIDPKSNQEVPVDCAKYRLCTGDCQCTEQGCSVEQFASVKFDMQLHYPNADGSVVGVDSMGIHNIHLVHP